MGLQLAPIGLKPGSNSCVGVLQPEQVDNIDKVKRFFFEFGRSGSTTFRTRLGIGFLGVAIAAVFTDLISYVFDTSLTLQQGVDYPNGRSASKQSRIS